jgi:hypothetical protein
MSSAPSRTAVHVSQCGHQQTTGSEDEQWVQPILERRANEPQGGQAEMEAEVRRGDEVDERATV